MYIGIDEKGEEYKVFEPDFENMSALCSLDECVGLVRCSFVEIKEIKEKK